MVHLFFCPYMVFRYNLLPVVRAEENETDSQFADRVQTMTAHNLGLYPTTYTFMDKVNAFKLKR
eukprot:GAFH01004056.1.p3 GENE.GAFH01004056.1~~GAFH01004056.1.p3  ORF type:complete len:64 (-),score=31.46 GAFH01004056.1:7-198(-)